MYKKYIKRGLDIVISALMMPFFLILFIVVAPCIVINDFGPVFYNAKRLGKDGKVFKMYKFRSMKVNAPDLRNEDGSTFNSENDIRVTGIGRILRKTSLDEVPQILNVLKGDMSIVGPRPDLPDAMELYSDEVKQKLDVLPGITGFSQAYFRNSSTLKQRFAGDVYYAKHVSLWLDMSILEQTIKTVVRRDNIYRNEGEGNADS